jgi:hypothetical protein
MKKVQKKRRVKAIKEAVKFRVETRLSEGMTDRPCKNCGYKQWKKMHRTDDGEYSTRSYDDAPSGWDHHKYEPVNAVKWAAGAVAGHVAGFFSDTDNCNRAYPAGMRAKKKKVTEADEIGSAGGVMNSYGDTTHQFSRENACPYFMGKSELCFLDGRICLYDTETFPVCRRYKEGAERRLPGPTGAIPEIPPVANLDTLKGENPDPFVNPNKSLYKN